MKTVDTSVFVAKIESRVKPEEVDLGNLPPIEKPHTHPTKIPTEIELPVVEKEQPLPTLRKSERFAERNSERCNSQSSAKPSVTVLNSLMTKLHG